MFQQCLFYYHHFKCAEMNIFNFGWTSFFLHGNLEHAWNISGNQRQHSKLFGVYMTCSISICWFSNICFLLIPSCIMQSCQLLVCKATRELCTHHHIWHTLKYYICLSKQLCSYFNALHSLSIFNQVLCQHHFLRIVLFVEKNSRGLVPTLFVLWHVVLITCHTALTQMSVAEVLVVMCWKALIMAPVRIWDPLRIALSFVHIVQL
jgi:hypothetical protein